MTGRNGPGHRAVRATLGSAVALTVVLGATGCTSGSSSTAASAGLSEAGTSGAAPALSGAAAGVTSAAAAATAGAPAPAATSAAAPAAGPSAAAGAAATPADKGSVEGRVVLQNDATAGRSIIYTATLTLQVPKPADVATAANQAAHLAETNNGYLFSREQQDANPNPNPTPVASGQPQPANAVATADLTLKVPPSQYDALIGELQNLGKQLDIEAHTQDVTDQVVDTQARLTTQKASVQRIRTLLTKATTIGQIVEVEGQLTQREADLEALEGKLAVLKSQTGLATVTVHLESAPPKIVVVPPKPKPVPKPKHKIHGFVGGLDAGGRGFATVAIAFATVLGAVLPFLGLFLVLAVLAWWGRRMWLKNRRPATGQVTS